MRIFFALIFSVFVCLTMNGQNVKKLLKKISVDCIEIEGDSLWLPHPLSKISLEDLSDSLEESNNKIQFYNYLKNGCEIGLYGEGYCKNNNYDLLWLKTIKKSGVPPVYYAETAIDIFFKIIYNKEVSRLFYNYKRAVKRRLLPLLIEYDDTIQNGYSNYTIQDYITETKDISIIKEVNTANFDENFKLDLLKIALEKRNASAILNLNDQAPSPLYLETKIDALIELNKSDSIILDITNFLKDIYRADSNRIIPSSLNTNYLFYYNLHKNQLYYGVPPKWGPCKFLDYARILSLEGKHEECQQQLIHAIEVITPRSERYLCKDEIVIFAISLYSKDIELSDEFKLWFPLKE